MRVLVTGGASVVGSHLCERLLAEGHEVLAVDDLSTGSFAHVAHLAREPRFALVEHDVSQGFLADVDAVYHLALPSSRARYAADEVRGAMTCVAGTKHVLDAAARRGARVVMASSTARVGEGVRCAEAIARATARDRGLDVRFVRVPTTYGPRVDPSDGELVTRLAIDALLRPAIAVPDATVCLAWAPDVVETLVRVMAHATRLPPIIAPCVEATAFEIAEAASAVTGTRVSTAPSEQEIACEGARLATLTEAFPASMLLGLEPSVDLASGIGEVVEAIALRLGRRVARSSAVYLTGRVRDAC